MFAKKINFFYLKFFLELLLLNMNPAFERVLRDIHRIRIEQDGNKDKEKYIKKTPSIKTIQKNESIENFMKFQWTWTM
jgi:hypothetical protein